MTETPSRSKLSFWKGLDLWKKILIMLIAGLAVGITSRAILGGPGGEVFVTTWFKPIGTLFLNLIKMLIVPLIFSSLVVGLTSMDDIHKMGRIGAKTFFIYLGTTAVAISIGIGLGILIQPGVGIELVSTDAFEPKPPLDFVDTLLNIIPQNPISAMSDTNVLQIIAFAILFGIAINLAGEKGKPLAKVMDSLAETMYRLTDIVISFAPYGVFGLMAWVSGKFGMDALLPLAKIIIGVYLGCLLHAVITIGGIIKFIAGLNPARFFRGILSAQAIAFTTTSSSGTLPVTMECAEKNNGVSNSLASFVLPLGATINMDGTAIYMGIAALFTAQAYGIDLTTANYITIALTGTLASIGSAGVPGSGIIMLSLVLASVGLPLEGIALVAGIDRILDMARTALNVTGDSMVAVVVAKSEGELNMDVYESTKTMSGKLPEMN